MEKITLERTGEKDLRFTGEELGRNNYFHDTGSQMIALYRTKTGNYICYHNNHSQFQGEGTTARAEILDTKEDVLKFWEDEPLAKEIFEKLGWDEGYIEDLDENPPKKYLKRKKFSHHAGNMFYNNIGVAVYELDEQGDELLLRVERAGGSGRVLGTYERRMTRDQYEELDSDPYNDFVRLRAAADLCVFDWDLDD